MAVGSSLVHAKRDENKAGSQPAGQPGASAFAFSLVVVFSSLFLHFFCTERPIFFSPPLSKAAASTNGRRRTGPYEGKGPIQNPKA